MKNLLVIKLMLITVLCSCTSNFGNPVVECENGRFVGRVEDNGVMSFAKDGDPSQSGIPWGEYDAESRNTMIIGRDASMYMESDPEKEQREILLPYFYDY